MGEEEWIKVEIVRSDVKIEGDKVKVKMIARLKVEGWEWNWNEKYAMRQAIRQEVLELLPEDVADEDAIWNEVNKIDTEEFEKVFRKEIIKEIKEELGWEVKEVRPYEYEVIVEDECDIDEWIIDEEEDEEDIDIEKIREEYEEAVVEDLEPAPEEALGNTYYYFARKIARKLILEEYGKELQDEEREEEERQEEEKVKEEKEERKKEEEIVVLEYKRAIVVSTRDIYINLPKDYLRYLYRRYRKVPKYVKFKVHPDGKVTIEPMFDDIEIPKDKLEWHGITKV